MLESLQETGIRVSMGADEQMILDAVKAEVIAQLDDASLRVTITRNEAASFDVTLTKAGASAMRTMDFVIQ